MLRRHFCQACLFELLCVEGAYAKQNLTLENKTEDENTLFTSDSLINRIKADTAFADCSNLLFPAGNTAGLSLRDVGRLLPYHTNVQPDEAAAVLNYLKAEKEKGEQIFYPLIKSSQGTPNAGLFFFRGKPGNRFAVICPGGGFRYVGAIHEGFPLAMYLASQGINAFVIVYRVGGADIACRDLAQGIDFIFEHAAELKVSTKNYSLWGGSAGARMAAYLGSYSPTSFGGTTSQRPSAVIMQYTGHTDIGGQEPPTYAVVGDADPIANPDTMEWRINQLKRSGVPTKFNLIHGISHGFGLGTRSPAEGWARDALDFWLLQK